MNKGAQRELNFQFIWEVASGWGALINSLLLVRAGLAFHTEHTELTGWEIVAMVRAYEMPYLNICRS